MSRPDYVGRMATFHFSTHPPIKGRIIDSQNYPGDCWIVRRPENDWEPEAEFAIQQFDFMQIEPEDTAEQREPERCPMCGYKYSVHIGVLNICPTSDIPEREDV